MSKQALEAFRRELAADESLRAEMTRVLGAGGPMVSLDELVALAKARGFELTADEARSATELTERDLDAVAGGVARRTNKIQDSED